MKCRLHEGHEPGCRNSVLLHTIHPALSSLYWLNMVKSYISQSVRWHGFSWLTRCSNPNICCLNPFLLKVSTALRLFAAHGRAAQKAPKKQCHRDGWPLGDEVIKCMGTPICIVPDLQHGSQLWIGLWTYPTVQQAYNYNQIHFLFRWHLLVAFSIPLSSWRPQDEQIHIPTRVFWAGYDCGNSFVHTTSLSDINRLTLTDVSISGPCPHLGTYPLVI